MFFIYIWFFFQMQAKINSIERLFNLIHCVTVLIKRDVLSCISKTLSADNNIILYETFWTTAQCWQIFYCWCRKKKIKTVWGMRLFQIRDLVDFNVARAPPMRLVIVGYNYYSSIQFRVELRIVISTSKNIISYRLLVTILVLSSSGIVTMNCCSKLTNYSITNVKLINKND